MKTQINLENFTQFKRRLRTQISDDPISGFARVIVNERVNIHDDTQQIELVATTYYINPSINKIVPQMTHRTLSKGKAWFVDNSYQVVLVDAKGQPIPNPDYDTGAEESEANYPYLREPAYDRFAGFLFGTENPVSLPFIWQLNVALDDAKGYFDIKENYD
ncbi:hypothetical protein JSO59_001385 [Riemerella anatipestifer]|uniref:hypothetical protein n=1 Tax=Riemerella anatipestifer TaxID=34085 RepID=UPI0030C0349A